MAKFLMIIAPEGYQDQEYGDTKKALENHGHTVITASTVRQATGKLGGSAYADVLLNDVNPNDYDSVVFIGGPGCYVYFDDAKVHEIARQFFKANKLTCAICAAPGILANAGVLEGKKATCWAGEGDHLNQKGATYTGNPVERDGLIITGDGPSSAAAFGEKIAEALT